MAMQSPAAADGLVKILGKMVWGEIRRAGRILRIVTARAFRGPLWQGAPSARKKTAATAPAGNALPTDAGNAASQEGTHPEAGAGGSGAAGAAPRHLP